MEEQTCAYCTGPFYKRKELLYTQTSDYKVVINEANYLEDNVVGGTVPHSVYGIKINYCPVCGHPLEENGAKNMTKRTGWEHEELEKEMRNANLADLILLYQREDEKYIQLCHELVRNLSKFTEEGKKEFEEQAQLQKEAMTKVALAMANMLTKTTKK